MNDRRLRGALGAAAMSLASLLLCGGVSAADKAAAAGAPAAASKEAGPPVMRRLTEVQFRNIIADVFGSTMALRGRFEPDNRSDFLIAIGAGKATITAAGFEQYDRIARGLGEQIVQPANRDAFIGCKPASDTAADERCATSFLRRVGRLLFRRPLSAGELKTFVDASSAVANQQHDFYTGISLAIAGVLSSPQFLYVQERSEPDPDRPGQMRLDSYSKASRLSFLLWNSAPDEHLLAAAEKGSLHEPSELQAQVDRMLASSRLEAGVRAFFTDMLQFELFDTLTKDPALYPKFTLSASQDAREQTLRTIVQTLLRDGDDYRSLFTTRKTFLTSGLAALYRVRLPYAPDSVDGWVPYEFSGDSDQSGILTQASFVALHSHPARTSATLRGRALVEIFQCIKVPDPPSNVNFTLVQDTSSAVYRTARVRLAAHAKEPTCAGCHRLTDPLGLGLENFDTSGEFRENENGVPIDSSGTFRGRKFTDAVGLGQVIHDQPATTSCLVRRLHEYGLGRMETRGEKDWRVSILEKGFAADGYRFKPLLRQLTTSAEFYRTAPNPAVRPSLVNVR